MTKTTTIAASGVPLELVQWIDEKAKEQSTNRSTIIRQILMKRVAELTNISEQKEREAA
jgi:metal-responsive CopG/Arc/MetJ family transcriptional regulator